MIKLVLTDCDGCLTDGRLVISEEGIKSKTFNIKDGVGFIMLKDMGIESGIISCDASFTILDRRFGHLPVGIIKESIPADGKKAYVEQLLSELNLTWDNVAYMGDDIPDMEVLRSCAHAFCPSDACSDVINLVASHGGTILDSVGGDGSFREMVEIIRSFVS